MLRQNSNKTMKMAANKVTTKDLEDLDKAIDQNHHQRRVVVHQPLHQDTVRVQRGHPRRVVLRHRHRIIIQRCLHQRVIQERLLSRV